MKKWLLTAFFFLSITTVFAQGKISGIIQDNNGPYQELMLLLKELLQELQLVLMVLLR